MLHRTGSKALSRLDLADGLGAADLWPFADDVPQVGARRLQDARVCVRALGDLAAGPFVEALRSLQIQVEEPGELGIVLTDDYLRDELLAYNEEALEADRPWLLVRLVGSEIWVGPVFRPGRTGCWECLAQRLRAHGSVDAEATANGLEPLQVPRGLANAARQLAWELAAAKVADWIIRGERANLDGRIHSLDVRTWQTQLHALAWQPQCPACGAPPDDVDQSIPPVVLKSCKKAFTRDGGHRVISPEATLERYEHHVSPITGAVSQLSRHGVSKDGVLHVYSAGHNFAMGRGEPGLSGRGLRSHSSGKGMSDAQARASGLCEALERYSGVFRGDEPRRRARNHDLGDSAIHPNDCMLFSERQYRGREVGNATASRYNFVAAPFDEEAEIEWTPVWSLTRREARYLPTAFCYYNYPFPGRDAYCSACSNGNAAGNTIEEAILQGFLELVERDSVALWWYNRVRRPAVDLESFEEPYLCRLAAYLRRFRRVFWVLDLTSDLGIPAFAALSRLTSGAPEEILFGFGAHLDARIAVLRAAAELNQFLAPGLLRGAGERRATPLGRDRTVDEWLGAATLANQPYLTPDPSAPPRVASDYPQCRTDDLRDDVLACQALVERLDMEMLVLDQTRPDIGLPVVKVIVPGLRHFWTRFAPGRLYDIPVRLGWLAEPMSEESLNPIPMFV